MNPEVAQPPASSTLPGVQFGRLAGHGDARGTFTELWRASEPVAGSDPFVQANLSSSAAGVLRGLHVHRHQLDYWVVVSGHAFVALVDTRLQVAGSSQPAPLETRVLGPDDWVVIPPGVAHGFLALEEVRLLYFVTNEFDGSDELGFAWDDPAVGVPWPGVEATADRRPIVSERDASNPPLGDLVARLGG